MRFVTRLSAGLAMVGGLWPPPAPPAAATEIPQRNGFFAPGLFDGDGPWGPSEDFGGAGPRQGPGCLGFYRPWRS